MIFSGKYTIRSNNDSQFIDCSLGRKRSARSMAFAMPAKAKMV